MLHLRRKIIYDLALRKVYLSDGKDAPKGRSVETGEQGGRYYTIPYSNNPDLSTHTKESILADRRAYLEKVKKDPSYSYHTKSTGNLPYGQYAKYIPAELPESLRDAEDTYAIDNLEEYHQDDRFTSERKQYGAKYALADHLIRKIDTDPSSHEAQSTRHKVGSYINQKRTISESLDKSKSKLRQINYYLKKIGTFPELVDKVNMAIARADEFEDIIANHREPFDSPVGAYPKNHLLNIANAFYEEHVDLFDIKDVNPSEPLKATTAMLRIHEPDYVAKSTHAIAKEVEDSIVYTKDNSVLDKETGKILTNDDINNRLMDKLKPVAFELMKKKPNASTAYDIINDFTTLELPMSVWEPVVHALPGNYRDTLPDYIKKDVIYMSKSKRVITIDHENDGVWEPDHIANFDFDTPDDMTDEESDKIFNGPDVEEESAVTDIVDPEEL